MWVSHRGESADEPPTADHVERWRERMCPPENEFPTGVGLTALLGRTGDAAVGITQIEAFSTGFRFTLAVRLRQPRPDLARGGLFMLIGGHSRPGFEVPLRDRLLLGIEYANGDRASTLQDMRISRPDAVADEQRLVLAQQGGGGGDRSVDQTYWVSPLPAEGPVTFVMAWPAFGMPESRTVLDGTAIRAAGGHSHLLWPPQPLMQPSDPPPPPRPPTGWFAEPPD